GQAFHFFDLQSAATYIVEGRPARPQLDGPAGKTAAGCLFPRTFTERARASERWRASLRSVCCATRISKDLYNDVNGGREERQHGRSAHPLRQFSEDGPEFQEKVGGFADISGAVGVRCYGDAGFPGDLRGAAICETVLGPECAVAGNHAVHAGSRDPCAALCPGRTCGRRGGAFFVVEMEGYRPRRTIHRPRHT